MKVNVYLRPLRVEDAAISYKWRNKPEIWKHSRFRPTEPITYRIEYQWLVDCLGRNNECRRAICIKDTDEYIGNVQIIDISDSKGVFHLFIGEDRYWGRGVGKQATEQMLDIGFFQLKLDLVWLEVHQDNYPAASIYKQFGFQDFSTLGKFKEMAVTKDDYIAAKRPLSEAMINR